MMHSEDKKPYCKPVMQQVKLVPQETVLGGCKTDTGQGIGLATTNCLTAVPSCINNVAS